MNETNKLYLKDCLKENNLMALGTYDKEQDYGIFHKWGKKEHVIPILNAFKKGMKRAGLNDVFITIEYPNFTENDLHDFIERASGWTDFLKEKGLVL
jgi:hypothetical protein